MEKPDPQRILQLCQESLVLNATRYAKLVGTHPATQHRLEALFLLTYKQDFFLNVRVDGKLDIETM